MQCGRGGIELYPSTIALLFFLRLHLTAPIFVQHSGRPRSGRWACLISPGDFLQCDGSCQYTSKAHQCWHCNGALHNNAVGFLDLISPDPVMDPVERVAVMTVRGGLADGE